MDDMTERGALTILELTAADLISPSAARVIVKEVHAALTPADLATLAEGMGLAVVPVEPPEDMPEAVYSAMVAAGRIKPGQEGGGDDQE